MAPYINKNMMLTEISKTFLSKNDSSWHTYLMILQSLLIHLIYLEPDKLQLSEKEGLVVYCQTRFGRGKDAIFILKKQINFFDSSTTNT